MTFSSRTTQRSSPGVPFWNCRGARLVAVAKALLPRPPRPPAATTTCSPGRPRSRRTLPRSRSWTTVPGGTARTRSSPFLPWQLSGMPRPPGSARQNLRVARAGRQDLAVDEVRGAVAARHGADDDVAAVAAVAAVGPAPGDVLLPAEAGAPGAAVAALDEQHQPIDERHRGCSPASFSPFH